MRRRDRATAVGPAPGRTALLVAAAAVVASWVAAERGIAGWEDDVGRWAYDLPDTLTPVLEVVMQAGTRPAPVVFAAVLAVAAGWRWRAFGVVLAGLLGWGASRAAKAIVDRPRPTEAALGRAIRDTVAGSGYPSTHAAIATAVATAAVLLGRPARWLAALVGAVAALTALARVHLGVHWTLDVVGGSGIGALVGVAAAFVVGMPPTGPVERAGGADELVVATFNIRNGRAFDGWNSWPFRARSAAVMARQLGADILAVQEAYAFQSRFLAAALPGYERVGRGRNQRGGEWCAIYVRADQLRVESSVTRWFGGAPERPGSRLPDARVPRIATYARLVHESSGRRLDIVNTHLDSKRSANRLQSIEQLVTWLDPALPTIVAGDLNATREEQPELFQVLESAGLTDAVPREAGGTAHDYRGGTDHRRIDHIFVSHHWSVVTAGVVGDDRRRGYPSDHWPVSARLRSRLVEGE